MNETRKPNLARGASIMVVSVTLAKLLGIVYIFPLTRLIGDAGIGIYANAYNLYALLLTLSTAGFPTAMGKLVSERLAVRKYADVETIYRSTLRVVLLFGSFLFLVMWFGAPVYSYLVAIKDPGTSSHYLVWSIRAVAPCLLVVPMLAALRGYVQGFQYMEPSAYSQAVEQLVRVVAIVAGAALVMHLHPGDFASGAAAATFAAVLGAVAGLIGISFSVIPLRREFLQRMRRQPKSAASITQGTMRTLLKIALPVCLGASVVPLSGFIDSVTVQNLLMVSGLHFKEAEEQYGILSRQAFQLIQLPMAFAMAVGASVLPAIASAKATSDTRAVHTHISSTFRSMFFITIPVAAVLLVLSRPLDISLFGKTEGAFIISSVSFMGIFSSLELVSTYMLQAVGKMYRPVRNMIFGMVVKIILNLFLIIPFGIRGAAVATTIGYLASSALNVLAVKKYSKSRISVVRLALPSIVAGIPLLLALWGTNRVVMLLLGTFPLKHAWLAATFDLVVCILVGGVVYFASSVWGRAVSATELRKFPALGKPLSRIASRIQPRQSA